MIDDQARVLETHGGGVPDRPRRRRSDKFRVHSDLGTITVPSDYNHVTCLARFREKYWRKFAWFNEGFNDHNYGSPSMAPKPGERISVKIFVQTCPETSSEERLHLLRSKRALLLGAQGLALMIELVGNKLPMGFRHFSFDEEDRLWHDHRGFARLPGIEVQDNHLNLYLSHFTEPLYERHTTIVFNRVVEEDIS